MSNNNKNISSKNNISKELDDIFSNEELPPDIIKSPSHKPISTIVGKAFDAIEQKMLEDLQNDLKNNSQNQEKLTEEQKKSTIIGNTLNSLKKTVIGRIKSNKEIEIIEKVKQSQNQSNQIPIKSAESIKTEKNQNKEKPTKKLYKREEAEDDLFTEAGIAEDNEEIISLKEKLDEHIKTFLFIFDKYTLKAKKLFAKLLLKIGVKSLGTVNKALNLNGGKLEEATAKQTNKAQTNQVKEVKPITYLKANFEEMLSLNIIFTDNYDVPLYKNFNLKMTKAEQLIIMSNAIMAIQECAEFTKNQPPIKEGMFKDQTIEKTMENVNEETLELYLGYVKRKPKKYIGKKWKISETFATWLMNGSSVIENS